jgi:hypothetical protein
MIVEVPVAIRRLCNVGPLKRSDGTAHQKKRAGVRVGVGIGGELVGARPLGRFGSPMSDPSNPRMGFFPFKDRGFETFIRRDLIVRVRFFGIPHVLSPRQNEHSS